jgi:hypothetical protein
MLGVGRHATGGDATRRRSFRHCCGSTKHDEARVAASGEAARASARDNGVSC